MNGHMKWFLTVGGSERHGSRVRRGEEDGCPSWTQWFLNRPIGGGVANEGTMVERRFDVKSNEVRARGPCGGRAACKEFP